jgi:hypothetical protein
MLGTAGIVSVSRGEHPRARAAVVGLLVAALIVPAVAGAAASTRFKGKLDSGGDVSFKLKRKDGKRSVADWKWERFVLPCNGKPEETGGVFYRKDLRVENRAFDGRAVYRAPNGRVLGKAKVTGTFGPGFETAEGLFKVTGETPEGHQGCDSGLIRWDAAEAITPAR